MSVITLENLLEQIETLPAADQQKLVARLQKNLNGTTTGHSNGGKPNGSKPKPDSTYPEPLSVLEAKSSMRWIAEHQREYLGQWVALDGDRLIAHADDAATVYAAADAEGIKIPLVTYLPRADQFHCSYVALDENGNIA